MLYSTAPETDLANELTLDYHNDGGTFTFSFYCTVIPFRYNAKIECIFNLCTKIVTMQI